MGRWVDGKGDRLLCKINEKISLKQNKEKKIMRLHVTHILLLEKQFILLFFSVPGSHQKSTSK